MLLCYTFNSMLENALNETYVHHFGIDANINVAYVHIEYFLSQLFEIKFTSTNEKQVILG